MKSEFRDKRYSGRALRIDLMDAVLETRRWSRLQIIIDAALIGLQQGELQEGRKLTGVFTFAGQKTHGVFDAVIAKPDSDAGLLAANFEWINEPGLKILRTMTGERKPEESGEQPTMKVTFTRGTANWSLSGFLLDEYHGALEPGERFRGMIWMDKPEDPGLFGAHAIRVDQERHTLTAKFDDLPANTFALLEAVINRSPAAPVKAPRRATMRAGPQRWKSTGLGSFRT